MLKKEKYFEEVVLHSHQRIFKSLFISKFLVNDDAVEILHLLSTIVYNWLLYFCDYYGVKYSGDEILLPVS